MTSLLLLPFPVSPDDVEADEDCARHRNTEAECTRRRELPCDGDVRGCWMPSARLDPDEDDVNEEEAKRRVPNAKHPAALCVLLREEGCDAAVLTRIKPKPPDVAAPTNACASFASVRVLLGTSRTRESFL